jgi:hypothetical protein
MVITASIGIHKGLNYCTWASDKLHTGHFGLVNTILAFSGGFGAILIPQVGIALFFVRI